MSRVKRWTASDLVDGVGNFRLHSWGYFMDFVYQEMMDYENYIWRGQRCASSNGSAGQDFNLFLFYK